MTIPTATQLIDVRSSSEFAAGHIPGAINIPMEELDARLADLKTGTPVTLICQSGARARLCAPRLSARGFTVEVLEGGTARWAQHAALVSSKRTRWSLERQIRLVAGLLVLAGISLTLLVSSQWLWFCAFVGAGLTFSGLTDICLMGNLLSRMPWNRG